MQPMCRSRPATVVRRAYEVRDRPGIALRCAAGETDKPEDYEPRSEYSLFRVAARLSAGDTTSPRGRGRIAGLTAPRGAPPARAAQACLDPRQLLRPSTEYSGQ